MGRLPSAGIAFSSDRAFCEERFLRGMFLLRLDRQRLAHRTAD
jgi:hypothetical protein